VLNGYPAAVVCQVEKATPGNCSPTDTCGSHKAAPDNTTGNAHEWLAVEWGAYPVCWRM